MAAPAQRESAAGMSITGSQIVAAARSWGLEAHAAPVADALAAYANLLISWNARLSLTAIRDERELVERHLLEGLFAAVHQPSAASVLDFGSGTGIPGVVIALFRPEARITLAESHQKKASFLREVSRTLGLNAVIHAGRAEMLPSQSFDAVWMRAVERSETMLPLAAGMVAQGGNLCLLTTDTGAATASSVLGQSWSWQTTPLPRSERRVLHIGQKM